MATRKPLIVNPDASQIQELPNGDSLDGIANITATGSITAVQPNCLVSAPPSYSISSSTNTNPIPFQQVNTNVGGFTLTNNNSTIAVPIAGTYLISASVSGVRTTNNLPTDMVKFELYKNSSIFPHDSMYPRGMVGTQNNEEWNFTFTIPLALAASDTINVALNHLNTSGAEADIQAGYLSVVKLH